MLKEFEPLLANLVISCTFRQTNEGKLCAVVSFRPRKAMKDKKVQMPEAKILVHTDALALEQALGSQAVISRLAEANQLVIADLGSADEPEETKPTKADKAPKAITKTVKAAEPTGVISLAVKMMNDCQKLIDAADKENADAKWKAIVELAKSNKDALDEPTKERMKKMSGDVKAMPVQQELDLD